MKLAILKGTTSFVSHIFVQDSASTTGAGKTGLTNSSVTCYYMRNDKTSSTSSTVSAITTLGTYAGDATHSAFKEVDSTNMPGVYEFQPANNMLASGAPAVVIILTGTGIAPVLIEFELTGVDLTAAQLPANVTQWSGGAVPAPLVTGVPKTDTTYWGGASPNALNAGRVDAACSVRSGTCQTGSTSTTIVLDAGASATNNLYFDQIVFLTGGTGAGQTASIQTYTGSSKTATVFPAWRTTPDTTTTYTLLPMSETDVGNWLNGTLLTPDTVGAPKLSGYDSDVLASGTAQAGSSQYIQLAAGSSATTNLYQQNRVKIIGGTGVGQSRAIIWYDGVGKVAYINGNWTTAPDATWVYVIMSDVEGQTNMMGGFAQSSTSTTITLAAAASATDHFFEGTKISIIHGTGLGQTRVVTNYVGATKVATVDRAWTTNPDTTSGYYFAQEDANVNYLGGQAVTAAGAITIGSYVGNTNNLFKNAAFNNFEFYMTSNADHASGAVGAVVTATRSLDGGTFGACANAPFEVGQGIYAINLAATDLNANCVTLNFTASGCDARLITLITT